MEEEKILSFPATAKRTNFRVSSLRQRRVREALGLPAVRAGRRLIGFYQRDVEAVLQRERFDEGATA